VSPDAASSLYAIDAPSTLDVIFETKAPTNPGRWKYVYIRHTRTNAGNALTLGQSSHGIGDHFLIGNGNGAIDGEIQIGQRWNQQLAALPPMAGALIDKDCVSISLVGDFDRTVPTPTQLHRLSQLVRTLQSRLGIPAENIILIDQPLSVAGSGKYFPNGAFRAELVR
ncbi:MAG: N-acetylmuramoyl-L-alanine amidase, partial [Planctomycetota bacterium]|nr:N-acetylmuramoyl-L-alanine amidase [Planctomycetota bacterium]